MILRNLLALLGLSIAVLLPTSPILAQAKITTMWVYDETTFSKLSLAQRIAYPSARIVNANTALTATGLSYRFESPFIQPISAAPFKSTSTTSTTEVLSFLRNNPWSQAVRANDADIVVMVVTALEQATAPNGATLDRCGTSWDPPKILGPHRSESHAFAVIVDNSTCDDDQSINIAHELGHVLNAEHEIIAGKDDNGDTILPDPFNHAYKGGSSGSTIMVSTPQPIMLPGYSTGQAAFSNVKDFLTRVVPGTQKTPWGLVAAYRPRPPPTIASCPVQFVTCNGNTVMTAITPYLNEPYYISNIHMDTRTSSSQAWIPGYDGPFTCPTRGASSSFFYRLIVNTAFGSATCTGQVYVNPWDPCLPEDEPW